MTRWELSPAAQKEHSRETLLKNKALAFDLMLPRVTFLELKWFLKIHRKHIK